MSPSLTYIPRTEIVFAADLAPPLPRNARARLLPACWMIVYRTFSFFAARPILSASVWHIYAPFFVCP